MGIIDVVIAYSFIKDLTIPFKKTDAYKLGIIDDNGKILKKRSSLKGKEAKAYPTILTTLAWNIKRLLTKIAIGRSSIASFATALYLLKEEMKREGIMNNSVEKDLISILQKTLQESSDRELVNKAFESFIFPEHLSPGDYRIFTEEVIRISEQKKPTAYSMGIPIYEGVDGRGKKIVFSAHDIEEEVPANNVGQGMIKGIAPGEDPPIRVKKKKKIYELMGRYAIFEISPEEFEKCTSSKKKFEKWNKYFDEDSECGNLIKKYSYHNPDKGIILKNSETGQTMMLRRRWDDQRLSHNRKAKLLVQSKNKVYSLWSR